MKRNLTRIVAALVLCMMTGAIVFAKEKSRVISFGKDFVVGSTEVKAGTYRVTYNDESNELTISDRKTKTVLARATARLEKRAGNPNSIDFRWANDGDKMVLLGLSFPGDSNQIVLSNSVQSASLR